ncbi:hypothetical protein IMG5_068490 [Ichthyophthirius multifiliis]|uniref:FHA domain-containing protein n=1 Tax=Ichthyophthirius multifiliis TaxID=5932 RepID=G0QPJ3_ICHMU|nr:hypothetical protein IMG5_068490 [Ichthyophthirius multifiliis]EGR32872.1 hypothetical protein IMG5_068490 [Ichthyophthirius multifiliis]|eukprot:XP_004036858.1 hypothetical protein IMG5_068490 [Ichthyophthirius multifiliis]
MLQNQLYCNNQNPPLINQNNQLLIYQNTNNPSNQIQVITNNQSNENIQINNFAQTNNQVIPNTQTTPNNISINVYNRNNNSVQLDYQNQTNVIKNEFPQDIKNKYYTFKKQNYPNTVDYNAPYMKIQVMKTNQNNNQNTIYYITPQGMVASKKNTETNDIIIGRQDSTKDPENSIEVHPNDIVLPNTDRAISRIHCKIIYKDGFNVPKKISLDFFTFLKGTKKNNKFSSLISFPEHVLRIIWKFIKPKSAFYLVDIGSAQSTFTKIKFDYPQKLEKGQVFLIGAETQFHVVDVDNYSQQKNVIKNTDSMDVEIEAEENRGEEDFKFTNYLLQEKTNSSIIHGLTEQELQKIQALQTKRIYNYTQQSALEIFKIKKRPFVKLIINLNQPQNHIFIYNENLQDNTYKIGRSQECSVQININTISRKQTTIQYIDNQWFIKDGDTIRESANGTWMSLHDYRERNQPRKESQPKEITNGSEIKISESILKIEIVNNQPKKNICKQNIFIDEEQFSFSDNDVESDLSNITDY